MEIGAIRARKLPSEEESAQTEAVLQRLWDSAHQAGYDQAVELSDEG